MSIQDQLAFSLNRKDQGPNKVLAQEIADSSDTVRLAELIEFFDTKPQKELQKDCSLTLAWIAEIQPTLIAPYAEYLIAKLNDPINRVIWGSMIALFHIAEMAKERLFQALPIILDAMDAGTVVTRDYGFRMLIVLYTDSQFQEDVLPLIQEQLMKAPSNQLGQYTERLIEVVNKTHVKSLIDALEERRSDISNDYHIKRLNKNLKRLYEL